MAELIGGKKILFLELLGPDYSHSMVYDGFVQLFGRRQLVEYPEANAILFQTPGLGDAQQYVYRDEFYNEHDGGRRNWSREHILQMARNGEFAAAICGFKISHSVEQWRDVIAHIDKLAYIDGAEHGEMPVQFTSEMDVWGRPYVYFKRELRQGYKLSTGFGTVRPLPFCAVPQHNTDFFNDYKQLKYDLYFRGNSGSSRWRYAAANLFCNLNEFAVKWHDPETDPTGWQIDRKPMLQEICSSWLACSLHGNGMDTYRYWEIPYAGYLFVCPKDRTCNPA
jgi:hypothetical protein